MLVACTLSEKKADDDDDDPARVTAVEITTLRTADLDVLFVIDDSARMSSKQISFRAAITRFFALLDTDGFVPNLHVGVVSTDMGAQTLAGGGPIPGGCSASGEAGVLLASGVALDNGDLFVRDVDRGDGIRARNFQNTIDATVGQMVTLGESGCGIEQPLHALRVALDPDNLSNVGFLRTEAQLAIIILTDEDDCTVLDPAFLADDPDLGFLNSFRCTRFGVTCATGGTTSDQMALLGAKSSCTDNPDSTLVAPVAALRDAIVAAKASPEQIAVALVGGPAEPFQVELQDQVGGAPQLPGLAHTCTLGAPAPERLADPPARLRSFLAPFAQRFESSICSADLTNTLDGLAAQVVVTSSSPCLTTVLTDTDRAQPGLQEDCVVTETFEGTTTELARCDGAAPGASCWRLEADPSCERDQLRLAVTRAAPLVPGTVTRARCIEGQL
jgi:hypothetical protein